MALGAIILMKSGDNRIYITLLVGFVSLLAAMLIIWYAGVRQMDVVDDVLNHSQVTSIKMDMVANLMEIARSRTRLTMEMIHTGDIFERDEINQLLDRRATEFALMRSKLFSLGLSAEEKQAFKQLDSLIGPALRNQRHAAELALSDDPQKNAEATRILLQEVYPIQGEIVDRFFDMLRNYKQQVAAASLKADIQIMHNRRINYWVFISVITLSLIVAVVVVRHIGLTTRRLAHEKERAQSTIRSLGDAIITTDTSNHIDYLNLTAETLLGRSAAELVGMHLADAFPAYDETMHSWASEAADKLLSGEDLNPLSPYIRLHAFNNVEYDIAVAMSPILDIYGNTSGVIISFHDVTESQKLLKQIQYQASHDALTGLLNRDAFKDRVCKALKLFEEGTMHAMCLIDLDSFKAVNDSCGHAAGDELLRQLSENLKTQTGKHDFFARLGGDEFALFMTNTDIKTAMHKVREILENIKRFQFIWEDKHFRIGASIGMIEIPARFSDYDYLYKAIDTACYLAKDNGRNQIRLVHIDDHTLTQRAIESDWIDKLNRALEQDHFILCGQSIRPLSLRTQGRSHIEVLLRLHNDRQDDLISPMAFIPVAERYGMMDKIDIWVFHQICQLIKDSPLDDTVYAVNLSGQTLSSSENMRKVHDIARNHHLPPGRLCLEITETAAIANLEQARSFMEIMQSLGCYVALDDFGSGLSSFSYLKDLPLDFIKIDGSFVSAIFDEKSALVMIEAIHNVGKKLGLITIAEFIENDETLQALREIGVDMGQGYHFDRPRPILYDNYPGIFREDSHN